MQKLNKGTVGLAVGAFLALWHLVWLILVAIGSAKPLLDAVLRLHHISLSYSISPFSWGSAIGLIIVAYVAGYVIGWVFAALWNSLRK